MTSRRTVQFLVVIAVSLLFAGCGSNNGSSSSAQLRTINASGQQQDLDVLLDSTSFQTSILSETASAYATESSGNHTIQVEPSGTTTTLINQSISLNAGSSYTILLVEPSFASSDLAMTLLSDDNSAPSSGNIKLRIINASPDFGNLDAYVALPGTDLTQVSPGVGDLSFEAASAYQSVAAGTYDVYLTAPGQKIVLFDSGQLTFSAGQIRTLVLMDNAGGADVLVPVADLD